jgi:hypothetical protein
VKRAVVLASLAVLVLGLVALPGAHASGAHYTPAVGDGFQYRESITLTNGSGNYTGYSEDSSYNGSIAVTAVLPNGTETATYHAQGTYANNQGQSSPWSEGGTFSFSATTFHYVAGTDNQTGYTDPYVWFYMDNTLGVGATFYILNTPMQVQSTSAPFPDSASATGFVKTIFATGGGSYERHDVYGNFTASYQYKSYFDPATGYIVGYVYTESDSGGAGNGFTWTDSLTTTATSYPLTTIAAPPATSPNASPVPWIELGVLLIVLGIVVVVVVALYRARRRRASPLARHSVTTPTPLPPSWNPPPVDLIPRDQPPTPQVVLRETVKVPCAYCGTLIDSTATVCPRCGAART